MKMWNESEGALYLQALVMFLLGINQISFDSEP